MPLSDKDEGKRPRRRRPAVLSSVPTASSDDARSTVHIGQRLRAWREERRLTQEDAAGAAGITRNALGRLEAKQFPNPSLQTLLGLMRVYELGSLEELLGPLPSYRLAKDWEETGWIGTRRSSKDQERRSH